jgi:hypothetical protein
VPAVVAETECLATVQMADGNVASLLKLNGENITTSLHPSRGRLERGKFYRVTFEEIEKTGD